MYLYTYPLIFIPARAADQVPAYIRMCLCTYIHTLLYSYLLVRLIRCELNDERVLDKVEVLGVLVHGEAGGTLRVGPLLHRVGVPQRVGLPV